MWNGNFRFVIGSLVAKDFKSRYRNMSLGVLWSVLNPLILMGVLTFIFTKIFGNPNEPLYPIAVLCGLVPFNFFSLAVLSGSQSLHANSFLIKKVPVPREIFPAASVLSTCLHLFIQIGLLLAAVLFWGRGVNIYWLWLPVIWILEIIFVLGLVFLFSAINVYVRDTQYVVESGNAILFWLVPIFYSFSRIPQEYQAIYRINPVAALVMMSRTILLDGQPPHLPTLGNMIMVSFGTLAVGLAVFQKLKRGFYEYL